MYHGSASIYILTNQREEAFEAVEGSNYLRRHTKVIIFIKAGEERFEVWNLNPFQETMELKMVHRFGGGYAINSLFNELNDFGKSKLRLVTIPAGHYVIQNFEDSSYWGFEIEILLELERQLNFEHVFVNYTGLWGYIGPDGSWTGHFELVESGSVEMVRITVHVKLLRTHNSAKHCQTQEESI